MRTTRRWLIGALLLVGAVALACEAGREDPLAPDGIAARSENAKRCPPGWAKKGWCDPVVEPPDTTPPDTVAPPPEDTVPPPPEDTVPPEDSVPPPPEDTVPPPPEDTTPPPPVDTIPDPDPLPPPEGGVAGIWLGVDEIQALPTSGAAWDNVKSAADASCGTPDLSNQDDGTNVCVMAKALVFARIGGATYRDGVLSAVRSIVNSGTYSGRALALGRELAAYVIAADLIGLPAIDPALDSDFRAKLRELRTTPTSSGPSNLIDCHERRANNWGAMCGASRLAVAVYLGDEAEVQRVAQVFLGWAGDRSSYSGFSYGSDLSWQADPDHPVGINPLGATKDGHDIDGVLPEEQRRCGSFQWPPCETGYSWGALSGAIPTAWMLHRQGYPAFEWQDRALYRAVRWLYAHGMPASGDDEWVPWVINNVYGSDFPAPVPARPGKLAGWADWTHQ